MMIPEELITLIHEGTERECIEFKREITFSDRVRKALIARSISAIANTCDDIGYYVVGVIDKKDRLASNMPNEYIYGFDHKDISDVALKINKECLDFYLNNVPHIEVSLEQYPNTSKFILIVKIKPPFLRPYSFKKESDKIPTGTAFVRLGPSCEIAGADDIARMILTRKDIGIYGGDIIKTLQVIIDERENRKLQLERLLDSDEVGSTQRVIIRQEILDIDIRLSYAYETILYFKDRIRFEEDIKSSSHRKRHRMIISRAEEIISTYAPAASQFPNLLKRIYDDAVDLYYQDIKETGSTGLAHHGLAILYENYFGNRRKAFEHYSESILLSDKFNKSREYRIEVSRFLISESDELYAQDAREAIIEDLKQLGRFEELDEFLQETANDHK